MISDTLSAELQRYQIGQKIRELRVAKGISLVELGKHSGLSSGLLSKIERNLLVPPLPTLLRIALVFSVGLEHFFTERARPLVAVVRKKDRLRLPDDPASDHAAYFFESLNYSVPNRMMDAYLAHFRSESSVHRHPGPELIFVLRGTLVVRVEGVEWELADGDCAYFNSEYMHSYHPKQRGECKAIVVVAAEPSGAVAAG